MLRASLSEATGLFVKQLLKIVPDWDKLHGMNFKLILIGEWDLLVVITTGIET